MLLLWNCQKSAHAFPEGQGLQFSSSSQKMLYYSNFLFILSLTLEMAPNMHIKVKHIHIFAKDRVVHCDLFLSLSKLLL